MIDTIKHTNLKTHMLKRIKKSVMEENIQMKENVLLNQKNKMLLIVITRA